MFSKIFKIIKNNKIKSAIALFAMVVYYLCLPKVLFDQPYATVVEDENANLLGAKIATDGQWRFPKSDTIPHKFKECLIHFEDAYFYNHWGINPVSISKAAIQNIKSKKVVRGGSTITQQVIRLHRKNKKRSFFEKFIEFILATRLEFRHSKAEILNLYASHAPFGGNVVGLEMASYRYFGLPANKLSWAESATLAVLPNAPSLIYPGKNQQKLLNKRNNLLKKLRDNKIIDEDTYQLAILEDLPIKPFDLPQTTSHLVMRLAKTDEGNKIQTTINLQIQERVNQIVKQYYQHYQQNKIYNIAVLVAEVDSRNILAYVGNSPTDKLHQKDVDIIQAPRSTGSILKPFLYAAMLNDGEILPKTLVADIPTQISSYTPQNFENSYDGAVSADQALSRSLNIPFVLMLKEYTVNKFYEKLQKLQLSDINKQPAHYGLSLILGGAESNLFDLTSAYANLGSTLNYYNKTNSYRKNEFQKLNLKKSNLLNFGKNTENQNVLSAASIYQMFNAMQEVNRPAGDEAWKYYDSAINIAWKTGTSFGSRDAWAIGVNQKYVVGVWVGNASGEGRPGLTGVQYAGPILFDVFRGMHQNTYFKKPKTDLIKAQICTVSGHLASNNCPSTESFICKKGIDTPQCPYHKVIFLDKNKNFRVNASCESLDNMHKEVYFILPPVMQWYYKAKNLNYKTVPAYRSDCSSEHQNIIDFIYPKSNMNLNQTRNQFGELQPLIAKVAHHNQDAKVFWYLNDLYLGVTKTFHEMPINTSSGAYKLSTVDEMGNATSVFITIQNE